MNEARQDIEETLRNYLRWQDLPPILMLAPGVADVAN